MALQIMRPEHGILIESRKELGMTQQQVADKARIQLRQYQRFESGERNLSSSSFYIARKVLAVLGLDATKYHKGDYVLGDEVELSTRGILRVKDGVLLEDSKAESDE